MIVANMHEAKTRLSALVKSVEEDGETVILCRNGKQVAEIRPLSTPASVPRNFDTIPELRVKFPADYHPAEPLSEEEWPADCR